MASKGRHGKNYVNAIFAMNGYQTYYWESER